MIKNIGKFKQWTGERLGFAKVTLQTEDFQRLEVETDRKRLAFEKVHAAANIMQSQLGKRKPSPEDNFKTKRQPNDILGVCWINYGNEFTDDAALGNSLVGFGQAQSRLGDYQEDFANAMKTEYLDKLEEGMNQFKEYQALRKKLESRRLDYDAKLTRLQKSKKEKPELEQEMQAAKIKYEESEYDLIQKLAQLQEFEDEHCEALYQLLELQTQHLTRSLEMVQQVKANWGRGTPSVVNARQTKLTSVSRPELGIARQSSTDFSLSPRLSPNIRKPSFQEEPSHLSPRLSPNIRKASIHEEPSHFSPRLSPAARSEDTRPPLLPRKTSQSTLPKRKALYDFVASSPDELDFKTNNVIQVVEQLDEGWWLGELEGRRGIFPVNYTEVIQGPPLPTRPTLIEESPFESPASPLPRRIPPPPPASRTPPVSAFQSKTDYFGACAECGCNEFTANVFKKGHCNNCFHKH
ncbi:unnamed protein product [Rhizopus stolonifer]